MKTLRHCLVASVFVLLIPSGVVASTATSDQGVSGSKSGVSSPAGPVATLKRGMSADEVRQIMDRPIEIKPMAAPTGKAEIWIFKRKFDERIELVQVGTQPVMTTLYGPDGRPSIQTTAGDARYATVHYATEETIQLLLYDGRFVSGKVSRQAVKFYD